MTSMKITLPLLFAATVLTITNLAAKTANPPADPGWPRQRTNENGSLVYYQPQIDAWTNFKELTFRMAFSLTPKGQKEIVGVIEAQAQTDVNMDDRSVLLRDFKINEVKLPGLDPAKASQVDQAVRSFLPPGHTVVMALDRLVASVEKTQAPATVQVQNDPPKIFVSYTPAILLDIDGEPTRAEIADTNMGFVVNSNFPLFFEKGGANYLFTGEQWLKAPVLEGPWAPVANLPKDMTKVANDPQWAQMKKPILSPSAKGKPPTIFYSNKPAEVILFQGQPAYANIPGTQLSYATNTDADLFVDTAAQQYYYLAAGRWFKAADLRGPLTYATPELPPDFAKIPENSPAARVLVSVPGTDEAKDAVLMAQVPTTAVVDPKAAEQAKVSYSGDPEFKSIEGTSLQYATNTADKVIKVGDVYYLCLQGVWFMSPNPSGPWTTATSVPQEIYTIPPSSPVYNVTYVTQTANPDGTIQASYTAGYFGAFVLGAATGAIIANNTGYYYPPYVYRPAYGYARYYPYATAYGGAYWGTAHYNSATGAYGWSQTAYGPYGSATRGAAYNPYTGTAARGATVSTPYGSRSAAQAYNPYTGTYAQTRQGSSPTAQWGSSYVSRGNESATMGHYSTANGTVAGAEGSQGGKVAASSTKWGNTAAGKTASGNMYAGHDGNVYKNTGNGWQKYDNGSWNSMSSAKPNWQQAEGSQQRSSTQSSQARSSASSTYNRSGESSYNRSGESGYNRSGGGSSSEMQNMQREAQNRQRGGQESQHFQDFQRGGGDRFGGGGGWGGRDGGGGRGRR